MTIKRAGHLCVKVSQSIYEVGCQGCSGWTYKRTRRDIKGRRNPTESSGHSEGIYSLRRRVFRPSNPSHDEKTSKDEKVSTGPLDPPSLEGEGSRPPFLLQAPIREHRMHHHLRISPPIRLLDRPDPAPGGKSLNVSGGRYQPSLH